MEYPFNSDGSAYEWLVKTALYFEIVRYPNELRLVIEGKAFVGRSLEVNARKAYDWMNEWGDEGNRK